MPCKIKKTNETWHNIYFKKSTDILLETLKNILVNASPFLFKYGNNNFVFILLHFINECKILTLIENVNLLTIFHEASMLYVIDISQTKTVPRRAYF
jgi:hypothetical protein